MKCDRLARQICSETVTNRERCGAIPVQRRTQDAHAWVDWIKRVGVVNSSARVGVKAQRIIDRCGYSQAQFGTSCPSGNDPCRGDRRHCCVQSRREPTTVLHSPIRSRKRPDMSYWPGSGPTVSTTCMDAVWSRASTTGPRSAIPWMTDRRCLQASGATICWQNLPGLIPLWVVRVVIL